jgi:Zn-dependent peptidase ImmA (M78 family)
MFVRRARVHYKEGDAIEPTNLSKDRVEQYSGLVASTFEFKVGDDPILLVERLGGRIIYQDLDDWIEEGGSIFVHKTNDFDIFLPRYTHPLRDRFTIAHELGHYFLHASQGDTPIIAYRNGSTRIEWEANWFAAGLLMPKDKFVSAMRRLGDVRRVARWFGISPAAVEVRKNALGI